MRSLFSFSLVTSILAAESAAALGSNHFRCDRRGDIYDNCRLINPVVRPQADYRSTFVVDADFRCVPGYASNLVISAGENQVRLHYGRRVSINLHGPGPLRISDTDPEDTAFDWHDSRCDLEISVEKRPHRDTIAAWKAELKDLHDELDDANDAAAGFKLLSTLVPAFQLLASVYDKLDEDFREETELREALSENRELLEDLIFDGADVLPASDRRSLHTLLAQIEDLPLDGAGPVILAEILSEEDRDVLARVQEQLGTVEDAAERYQDFVTKAKEIENEIAEVEAVAEGWL